MKAQTKNSQNKLNGNKKMGDYGTKGAGECGGQDRNFHCLPDSVGRSACPCYQQGLKGDFDFSYSCLARGGPDADMRGWGYDDCDLTGDNYTFCPRLEAMEKRKGVGAVQVDKNARQ
ncbi:MAG: hypothetical protein WCK90_02230 [archaeon]